MRIRSYRDVISLFWIFSLAWLFVPARSGVAAAIPGTDHSKGIQFQRPPLRFEINEGQTDPQVRFTARDRDGVAYLTSDGAVFQISRSVGTRELEPQFKKASYRPETRGFESSFVRMKTVGANPNPRTVGIDRLPGVTNFLSATIRPSGGRTLQAMQRLNTRMSIPASISYTTTTERGGLSMTSSLRRALIQNR
jgi:hypothetical protein